MSDPMWGLGLIADLDAAGFRVLAKGSIWRPGVSVRQLLLELPDRHGNVYPWTPPVFEAPTVTLNIGANATSMTTLEDARQRLEALLTGPQGVTLTRTSGDQVATAKAVLLAINEGAWHVDGWWRLQVILRVPGVFFRGASVDITKPLTTGTVTLAELGGSTAPIGDAIVQITGPATSVRVTDPMTGSGIVWTGTLAAGTNLYIDVARMEAWTGTWSGGVSRSHELDFPPAGPLQLWPITEADLSRVVRASITATGTSGSTLTVRAAPTYF